MGVGGGGVKWGGAEKAGRGVKLLTERLILQLGQRGNRRGRTADPFRFSGISCGEAYLWAGMLSCAECALEPSRSLGFFRSVSFLVGLLKK